MVDTKTLALGRISKSGSVVEIGSIMLTAGEGDTATVGTSVTVAAGEATNVHLNKEEGKNYGILIMDADGNLTLKGGADLKGDITITDGTGDDYAKLKEVDFAAAVSVGFTKTDSDFKDLTVIKGSTVADSISVAGFTSEDFVLSAGAGNDTVVISGITKGKVDAGTGNDLVSVAGSGENGNVVLGAGKDTLVFGAAGATVNLADYNFNDDLIALSSDAVSLTAAGKLESAGTVVSGFTATNNLYAVRLGNGAASLTTVLATAAKDTTKVVVDAGSIVAGKLVINTAAADSANITLGKVNADVTLNGTADAGVDTVKIGNTSASVSVNVTNFMTDDVLSFTGLAFDKSTIAAAGDDGGAVSLTNGKVAVTLDQATVAAATGTGNVAKFNLNGTTLYAATADDQVINLTEEADLSKILVKGTNKKENGANGIQTAAKWVDLGASNIYNINKVVLTADTVAKASVVGIKNDKAAITIDASAAADGVAVWANNSSTKQSDRISLNASNDVADTLWFGSADGKDSVTGFQLASDVLYLYDATTLTAKDAVLKIGKAEMSVKAAETVAAAEEIMQVQGAKFAGTVYAAGDFINDGDSIIHLGDNAAKVNYYAVDKDSFVSVASSEDIKYAFLNSIDYAGYTKANIADKGSVASIDATNTTEDSTVIIEGVANVSLGLGTNEVWANTKNANVVLTAGKGTDKVYFGTADKDVTVDNFGSESDVIALMGTIDNFTAKKEGTDVVISNAAKGKMTLTGAADGVALVDNAGANFKLYVDDAAYTTNTDGTNIYLAENLTADSSVTDKTTIVEAEGVNNWGLTSSAIVGKTVKTIDMSGSSAEFILVGSASTANTITGGSTSNYLNGGGASKDVLNGVTGAVDYFYYGKNDGNDTLVNVDAEDTVVLYDIASTDLAATPTVKDDKTVIMLNNDSKLTIMGGIDGVTFQLTDGAYKYDSSADEKWVKQ